MEWRDNDRGGGRGDLFDETAGEVDAVVGDGDG